MEHKLPQAKTGLWSGMFKGKLFGDIYQSYNIDMESSPGRILLADRLQLISSSDFVAPDGSPTYTTAKFPTATGRLYNTWTNPANAYADDGIYATRLDDANNGEYEQTYENFNFNIPVGSTIQGIEIKVKVKNSIGNKSMYVKLYKGAVFSYRQVIAEITTSDVVHTYGGATSLLSTTWTGANFQNENFHLGIAAEGFNDGTFSVDYVTVKVWYTPSYPALSFTNVYRFLRNDASGTNQWWAICANKLLRNISTDNPQGTAWEVDPISVSPTDARDAQIHGGRMAVTRETDISLLTAGTWNPTWWSSTLAQPALTSQTYHPIERLNRLTAIGDGYLLHTIDENDVVANSFLTFATNYYIRNIYAASDRFWLGLGNKFGGKGKIVEWDGYSNNPTAIYEIDGTPITGFVYKNSPFFIDEFGDILSLQGSYFGKYGISFPIYEEQKRTFDARNVPASIFNHGCAVFGDEVLINVCSDYIYSQRTPSGVWRLNMETKNIYHGYGFSKNRYDAASTVKDYGEMYTRSSGAIAITNFPASQILVGGIFQNNSCGISCIIGGIYNRGYIITSLIPSNEIDDTWETVWLKFRKFINYGTETKTIVLKYRTEDSAKTIDAYNLNPKMCQITWDSAVRFHGSVPTGVVVGDEVEIITGDNSGCSAHILSLSGVPDDSTVITVDLDESMPQYPSGYSLARFDNWSKIGTITDTTKFFTKIAIPKAGTLGTAPFIQLKIELRGIRNELHEIKVISKTQNEAEL